MLALCTADHRRSPPDIHFPAEYNAAHDLIERNLQAGRTDKVAYIDDRGSYTYGELAERVNRCANALVDLGVRPEERMMLCLHDTIDFPTAFLGCIKAGIVPIAVNTLLTANDYRYMLGDSRARAPVLSAPLLPTIGPLLAKQRDIKNIVVSKGDPGPHQGFDALLEMAAP